MNNYFMVVGRTTKDLELRYTTNNKAVLNLTIAVNNGKDDNTFLTVEFFGSIAENINKYVHKGDLIGVSGSIKNHNWEDKEGKKHYEYRFIGNKITFLSTKKSNNEPETIDDVPKSTKTEYDTLGSDVQLSDDGLPF